MIAFRVVAAPVNFEAGQDRLTERSWVDRESFVLGVDRLSRAETVNYGLSVSGFDCDVVQGHDSCMRPWFGLPIGFFLLLLKLRHSLFVTRRLKIWPLFKYGLPVDTSDRFMIISIVFRHELVAPDLVCNANTTTLSPVLKVCGNKTS